ncbi:hypothetical protein COT75_05415 [Candidatus Beckwithbacteria bacterium CG10_big_fil_rev_8_21_14_0_10_34_10]|uniref:Uncharacterized protein n=1 Tax=Candidatus Beckwithbacteria bacterium CG10_big_fil_rev_8_21_14_0_10_34_10 TaxID=1974495 RepID=A0A2H0W9U3_9BACT|nr:MAG: hypothetical protein COT75_05415 [Candidatus Beckwithbacteria bacterium CG10_big_fil_rev_8_21_14_0_10_34_10]
MRELPIPDKVKAVIKAIQNLQDEVELEMAASKASINLIFSGLELATGIDNAPENPEIATEVMRGYETSC